MTDDKKYYDIDGNEVSLDALCRKEPAWAANVIRTLWAKKEAREAKRMRFAGFEEVPEHLKDPFVRNFTALSDAFDRGRQEAFQEMELARKYTGEGERHRGASTATQLVFALAKVEKLEAQLEDVQAAKRALVEQLHMANCRIVELEQGVER